MTKTNWVAEVWPTLYVVGVLYIIAWTTGTSVQPVEGILGITCGSLLRHGMRLERDLKELRREQEERSP